MLELFKAKAEAVAEVLQVPAPAAAVDAVLGVLERERVALRIRDRGVRHHPTNDVSPRPRAPRRG